MIHVIDNHSADSRQELIRSMFVDRKQLFVDFLHWDLQVTDGRYEIDQFDTAQAVYILVEEEGGQHAASLRLMPTLGDHMLGTIFPALCPLGVPVGEHIWESSRLCLPRRHGAARRKNLRNQLISAMVDLALARGIERYTGILPEAFRKEVLAMGWRGEPLGPAARMHGGAAGAFLVEIDAQTPARLCWSQTYVDCIGEVVA